MRIRGFAVRLSALAPTGPMLLGLVLLGLALAGPAVAPAGAAGLPGLGGGAPPRAAGEAAPDPPRAPGAVDGYVAHLTDAQARSVLLARLRRDAAAEASAAAPPMAARGEAVSMGLMMIREKGLAVRQRLERLAAAAADWRASFQRVLDLATDLRGWSAVWPALGLLVLIHAAALAAEQALHRGAAPLSARGGIAVPIVGAVALIGYFLLVALLSNVAFPPDDPLRELVTAVAAVRVIGRASRKTAERLGVRRAFVLGRVATAVAAIYVGAGLLRLYGLPDELGAILVAAAGTLVAASLVPAQAGDRAALGRLALFWLIWAANVLLGRQTGAWGALLAGMLFETAVALAERRRAAPGAAGGAFARAARVGAGYAVVALALLCLAEALGLGVAAFLETPTGRLVMHAALRAGVALLVGLMAWTALRLWIDRRLGEDGGDEGASAAAVAEAEGGTGKVSTRLQTLLPLFRTFAAITLVVLVGLIVLSSLGIDIGPLLAGAGIVGLAIGFGAQSLVRDVVSGVFFLIDDAFRLGEYIEFGHLRGEVERISIRSLQLRHHRGAVHTVPFGEIKSITNYNRDWVILKMNLSLHYDTDVQLVKRIIKRIGAELQADPVHGRNLLEPLKSQGIIEFGQSAIIVRVKFKCRPREQFVLRRVVNERIKQAFEEAGIRFAYPTVTVHGPADIAAAATAASPELAGRPPDAAEAGG